MTDEGMSPEEDPVRAEVRAVRMAAYAIVKHIDEFGEYFSDDVAALDAALEAASPSNPEPSNDT